ncbi:hypothetical protein D9Q98_002925 [Chlorella vulgaris]|uniref:Uncharacterized protein n=1 Tax=Chlorella vulgaris TaxID=3077 RepID=A0A9D4YZX3_CHLVU|nr:hypothetical protein D9Q98_002925 [Chlorella vulgaris]
MAGARLKVISRRRGFNWTRLLAIAGLAAIGGVAVWNGLQYSVSPKQPSYDGERIMARQELDGSFQEDAGDGQGGKAGSQTDMAAWTQLTEAKGGAAESDGGGGDGDVSDGGDVGTDTTVGGAQGGERASSTSAAAGGGDKNFLTVVLKVPEMPPTYNSWVQTEDMLLFHLRALQLQLEQLYIGMALAAAAGRAFVLPDLSCFCQNAEAPLARCRRPDSEKLQFPAACRENEVLMPLSEFGASDEARGTAVEVRHADLLERLSADTSENAQLVVRPSAQILFPACKEPPPEPGSQLPACTQWGAGEGEQGSVVLVPPSLNDTDLLPLLAPLAKYRLWTLDLTSDIGSHWHAFAGWDCKGPAHQFDLRMSKAAVAWPSPRAAAVMAAGGGPGDSVMHIMRMTGGRTYSDEPDMKDC